MMDPGALSPGRMVAFLVNFVIQLLLPILQVVMLYAPLAIAYHQIAPQPDEVAEAFGT